MPWWGRSCAGPAARALSNELLRLADEDAAAYAACAIALKLPRESFEDQELRDRQIRETAQIAAEVPLRCVERCLDALVIAESLAGRSNRNASSDLRVASLLLEAAALSQALPPADTIADLGSGAGIPGLPLALCRPGTHIRLIESRERRHHFQRAAIRALGLSNAEPVRGRAEELEALPHAIAVAQAMGEPGEVAAWLLRWVEPGGLVAIPGGAGARSFAAPAGLGESSVVTYQVPLGGPERTVWLARRLPRAS